MSIYLFLVKGIFSTFSWKFERISAGYLIFDQYSIYGQTKELVFTSKMFEKHLWKSDILLVKTHCLVST